jgi:hypothetical protein
MKPFDLFSALGQAFNPSKEIEAFFNTNNTLKHDLPKENETAKCQQDIVLNLFESSYSKWTASLVWEQLLSTDKIDQLTPLTSIRRAISNLQRAGYLEKENETRMGMYGKNEHYYKLIK